MEIENIEQISHDLKELFGVSIEEAIERLTPKKDGLKRLGVIFCETGEKMKNEKSQL